MVWNVMCACRVMSRSLWSALVITEHKTCCWVCFRFWGEQVLIKQLLKSIPGMFPITLNWWAHICAMEMLETVCLDTLPDLQKCVLIKQRSQELWAELFRLFRVPRRSKSKPTATVQQREIAKWADKLTVKTRSIAELTALFEAPVLFPICWVWLQPFVHHFQTTEKRVDLLGYKRRAEQRADPATKGEKTSLSVSAFNNVFLEMHFSCGRSLFPSCKWLLQNFTGITKGCFSYCNMPRLQVVILILMLYVCHSSQF